MQSYEVIWCHTTSTYGYQHLKNHNWWIVTIKSVLGNVKPWQSSIHVIHYNSRHKSCNNYISKVALSLPAYKLDLFFYDKIMIILEDKKMVAVFFKRNDLKKWKKEINVIKIHHNFVWLFCFTFNFTGCVCLCMLEFVLELSCFLFVIYLPVAFITAATFF